MNEYEQFYEINHRDEIDNSCADMFSEYYPAGSAGPMILHSTNQPQQPAGFTHKIKIKKKIKYAKFNFRTN